jgi:aminoglycoside phosphotransferase (APT) family kinase protein
LRVERRDTSLSAALRTRLRAQFPSVRRVDLDQAAVIGEGWCTVAYRVGPLVVRVANSNHHAEELALEPRLLPALEAGGVPFVPHGMTLLTDEEGHILATAHEYVDGVDARSLPRTTGRRREELTRDFGRFLGALHSFPRSEAASLGVPDVDLWREHYVPLIEAARPHLATQTRGWLDTLCERFVAEGGVPESPRVLIHGDVDGRNVMLHHDGSLSGIIDFSDCMIADPALDFACILNDWSWSFLERLLAHYPLEVDSDARRRAAFYIAIAPLWEVREGVEAGRPDFLRTGRAKLAARARVR